jgi:hypothetical protein
MKNRIAKFWETPPEDPDEDPRFWKVYLDKTAEWIPPSGLGDAGVLPTYPVQIHLFVALEHDNQLAFRSEIDPQADFGFNGEFHTKDIILATGNYLKIYYELLQALVDAYKDQAQRCGDDPPFGGFNDGPTF